jgi:catechol 2,3-dioxygenase-like lactoylglutathione lyase family enzyme
MHTTRFALIALLANGVAPAQQQHPPITGIAFVRIYAKDPAASRGFYTGELLLPEATCSITDCARYQVGRDQYVEVVKARGEADGLQVIGFRTSDLAGMRRYLATHHVKMEGDANIEVVDPEGHRVAFVAATPGTGDQGAISHRLIHAGVIVRDRAAMDRFYRDILGFRPYWHGGMNPERTDWVALQVPDGTDWLEYMLNVPADASHQLIGVMHHFSLGVEDMDATVSALERTGWKSHGEERKQMGLDGKYQLNVFDPDEVRVEFMTFTPSRKPCCSDFTGPHPRPD